MNFVYENLDYVNNENENENENSDDDDSIHNESSLLLNFKDEDCSEYYSNYNNLEDNLSSQDNYNNLDEKNTKGNEEEDHFVYENCDEYDGFETIEEKESRMAAQILDYEMNYTIKQLEHILAYYDIQKKKMNKIEIIETIVQIENNPENSNIVLRRKEMFKYVELLKKDKYFGKFIMFSY